MVYPSVVLVVAIGVTVRAAALRHPDLREDVQGLRRRYADADADRDRSLEMAAAYIGYLVAGIIAAVIASAPGAVPRGGCSGTPSSSARRSSGRGAQGGGGPVHPHRWAPMISSGVPSSTRWSGGETAGNAVVEKAIRDTKEKIAEGKTIVQPLSETKVSRPWWCR